MMQSPLMKVVFFPNSEFHTEFALTQLRVPHGLQTHPCPSQLIPAHPCPSLPLEALTAVTTLLPPIIPFPAFPAPSLPGHHPPRVRICSLRKAGKLQSKCEQCFGVGAVLVFVFHKVCLLNGPSPNPTDPCDASRQNPFPGHILGLTLAVPPVKPQG